MTGLPGSAAAVRLSGVRFRWRARSEFELAVPSFVLGRTERALLVGPSGSGKSTLLNLFGGLDRPTSGEILFDGESLAPLSSWEMSRYRLRRIGMIFQSFNLIPTMTARENVSLALAFAGLDKGERRRRSLELLDQVGLSKRADHLPSELSGGELQRVVLARALARCPGLLVLDEPARGVDYAGEAELYTLIGRLRTERGFGVLLVSHDLHVVMAQSDRVICLNRHVCCSGVPQLVAQHPEYARLFGPQAARAFGVYMHQHDHRHDLAGEPRPPAARDLPRSESGS